MSGLTFPLRVVLVCCNLRNTLFLCMRIHMWKKGRGKGLASPFGWVCNGTFVAAQNSLG